MLKKTITYVDYNGDERVEDFYFNLSKAELLESQLSISGGLENLIKQLINTQDLPKIMSIFKDIIMKSYGEKSLDGKRFIKSKELTDAFVQTEAYSVLFMELTTDSSKAAEFINGIIPSDLKTKVEEIEKSNLKVVE